MIPTSLAGRAAFAAMLSGLLLASPLDAGAQFRRFVRPATRSVVVLGGYYRPFLFDPWFSPYYSYPWLQPYGPYGYAPQLVQGSALRIQVTPRQTEVFVDGYYAGTVDDFDGFLQRLRLEPGEHEVTLYLQGHRSATQRIYVQPGGTFRIRHTMEPLPAGAPQDPRPVAAPNSPRPAYRVGPGPGPQAAPTAGAGTLAIRVQPADAEVLIDGERWAGPAPDEQLVLEVVARAPHRNPP